jgi:hypothetical protein
MKFKVGDRVEMISARPAYGFGDVVRGDIGTIIYIERNGDIYADFENHDQWIGIESDFDYPHDTFTFNGPIIEANQVDALDHSGVTNTPMSLKTISGATIMPSTPKIGDKVRVIVANPKYKWGPASPESIGTLSEINGKDIRINFPEHNYWRGLISEIEVVEPLEEESEMMDLSEISNV